MDIVYQFLSILSVGRVEEAVCDFEDVLQLNNFVACAHVTLGLIEMTRQLNYRR